MYFKKYSKLLVYLFPFFSSTIYCQVDTSFSLTFDFNDHLVKEKDNKVIPKPVGISLVTDRFGNKESALYLHGHEYSYVNLSTSPVLKPANGTVSIWVNLERKVFAGCGYESNPILITRNSKSEDFNDAYCLFYDFKSDRFMVFSSKDSTKQAGVNSIDHVIFNKWYHLAVTYDSTHIAFYVDGELQLSAKKGFVTKFNPEDSVTVGSGASLKNNRYMRGSVDDIHIFHRVLSATEINDLYHEPNPNKFKNILSEILKYGIIILVLVGIIIILMIRNKRNLKKQKEQFELINRVTELELKVVKAQMNPHFISNCLAAIQELIYKRDIDKAGQYIAKFSYFLRQVLNYSDKNYITIAEEIELIKLNVELEQLRFKNNFYFELNIDEGLKINEMLIPSMITQPFIENAIWHGLLPMDSMRHPKLKINLKLQTGTIQIEIEDNGVGRNLNKISSPESKGTKLAADKLESLNRLSGVLNYKIEIIDLVDEESLQIGTKIVIKLENIKE